MWPSLLPRETSFFDFFDSHAARTVSGAKEFLSLVSTGANIGPTAERIKEIEHESDVIAHQCVEALHKTFVTPIERNDILRLITHMDDVMDYVEAAAERIALYELTEMTQEVKELAQVLVRAAEAMEQTVKGLRGMKDAEMIRARYIEVNRLENEADAVLRSALANLFRTETNPITVMKWKEIYEMLEAATDSCEDVANIIEGVLLEHG